MEELKPCPSPECIDTSIWEREHKGECYTVVCTHCWMNGPARDTKAAAREAWQSLPRISHPDLEPLRRENAMFAKTIAMQEVEITNLKRVSR